MDSANVQENSEPNEGVDMNEEKQMNTNEEKQMNANEEEQMNTNKEKQPETNGPTLIDNKDILSFATTPVKHEPKPELRPEVHTDLRDQEHKVTPPKRKEINNPFKAATSKVSYLIYWENPTHSGATLAAGLSIIIFTSYYSLINISFALIISLLGLSWVVVTGKKQCQNLLNTKSVNPFEHFLVERPIYVERALLEKYLDVCVDGVNFVLQESQKICLVESPSRTFKYVISLYFLWTILGWFSIYTLASIALILGFSVPIAYKRNKETVDKKLEKVYGAFDSHMGRATGFVKHHTKGVVEKGRSFAANKGLVKEE